jgi:hypothetical protein
MDSYVVSSELPCVLPYRGEFGETADFAQVGENASDRERFLAMLLRDPHLAELDHDLNFAEMILAAQGGGMLDIASFLDRARLAIDLYVRRAGNHLTTVFARDPNVGLCLEQKVAAFAYSVNSATNGAAPPPLKASQRVKHIFGRGAYYAPLTAVRAATVLNSERGDTASSQYAFRLSTPADAPSEAMGTARSEVGRSVYVDDIDFDPRSGTLHPADCDHRSGCIKTQIIVKGVGPTRYANNRFSPKVNGGLTWLQGQRDWAHSEALARGGVPVYRPLELVLLPYCDWHPSMGWRPLVSYARLPLENLRISDLELLSWSKRRTVIISLRAKVAALADVPARRISAAQLVRFFVARLGRIAGLCEAGRTFDGRPFFHAFLHRQNVSLLGELVDLGEGRFVNDAHELGEAYARSNYVVDRAWSSAIRGAGREAVPFQHLAHLFAALVAPVLAPGERQPATELDRLFWHAHAEGATGLPAADVDTLLGA